jgi:hypothetical protein
VGQAVGEEQRLLVARADPHDPAPIAPELCLGGQDHDGRILWLRPPFDVARHERSNASRSTPSGSADGSDAPAPTESPGSLGLRCASRRRTGTWRLRPGRG